MAVGQDEFALVGEGDRFVAANREYRRGHVLTGLFRIAAEVAHKIGGDDGIELAHPTQTVNVLDHYTPRGRHFDWVRTAHHRSAPA